MQDDLNFNASEVPPVMGQPPLPAGKYMAYIREGEMRETSTFDGKYLRLVLQIMNPEHQGRLLFVNLNLINQNPMTVKLARGELSCICRATGVMVVRSPQELLSKPMMITARQYRDKKDGTLRNAISSYEAIQHTPQSEAVASPNGPAVPPPAPLSSTQQRPV